jgi:hypothetical protein
MPKSELHKVKFKKNLAVLAAVVVFMLIVFFVTIIRLKAGMEAAG